MSAACPSSPAPTTVLDVRPSGSSDRWEVSIDQGARVSLHDLVDDALALALALARRSGAGVRLWDRLGNSRVLVWGVTR